MPRSSCPPVVLTLAATDPTGGAGLQADVMTIAAMGCHPLSVVTAITVQDTIGVKSIHTFDPAWVSDQARAVLRETPVAAFKIGFIGSRENVAAIARLLDEYAQVPLVFDPVLASGRGDEMANAATVDAMRELLVPRSTVITPNSFEARRLAAGSGQANERVLPLAECAQRLLKLGARYVLVTGTHEATLKVTNTLYGPGGELSAHTWERLPGSYHGSGCTLASAVAANLAKGLDIEDAVREAQDYTWQSLAAGFLPGAGQYIPDRLYWARSHARTGKE